MAFFFQSIQYPDINLLVALFEYIWLWGLLLFVCLAFKLGIYIYQVATTQSGIHYVNQDRCQVSVANSIINPFFFEVNNTRTRSSEISCTIKCNRQCYVLPLWGVPISSLFDFLNKNWPILFKSNAGFVTFERVLEELVSKCAHNDEPFLLSKDIEMTVEFKHPPDVRIYENVMYLRQSYPFVLLMVLDQEDVLEYIPDSLVIGVANAVHISGNVLNKAQLIGQFAKLASGHFGQRKKVFSSSPAEGQMNDFCIICYQRHVSVVQIHCCHACVCQICYARCDKCPLCRNANMDFFVLPNLNDLSEETE